MAGDLLIIDPPSPPHKRSWDAKASHRFCRTGMTPPVSLIEPVTGRGHGGTRLPPRHDQVELMTPCFPASSSKVSPPDARAGSQQCIYQPCKQPKFPAFWYQNTSSRFFAWISCISSNAAGRPGNLCKRAPAAADGANFLLLKWKGERSEVFLPLLQDIQNSRKHLN